MDSLEASETSSAEAPATTASATTSSATTADQPIIPLVNPSALTPPVSAKILSRNANGTVVMTTSPANEAELQLYRVMQRASLLAYYDTLLEMGGDDVQQLCDAGEEEFLEIMALVGMASKPLHVRRLQKALQEWVANPGMFLVSLSVPTSPLTAGPAVTISNLTNAPSTVPVPAVPRLPPATTPTPPYFPSTCPPTSPAPAVTTKETPRPRSPQCQFDGRSCNSPGSAPGSPLQLTPILLESQISRLAESAESLVKTLPQFEPKPHNTKKKICRDLENVMTMSEDNPRRMEEIRKYAAIYGRFDCKRKPEKPLTLHEVSVNEAAAQICRFAPALLTRRDELFPLARQVVRDSGYHYSKTHASLAPLYRSSQHLGIRNGEESYKRQRLDNHPPHSPGDTVEGERFRRQERLEAIADELRNLGDRTEELVLAAQQVREKNDLSAIHSLQQQMDVVQNKQTQLLLEQSDLLKQPLPMRFYRRNSSTRSGASCSEPDKGDTDDTDSQLSLSNASSPLQEVGDSRDSLVDGLSNGKAASNVGGSKGRQFMADSLNDDGSIYSKVLSLNRRDDAFDPFSDAKVQVISASGGNIIAVANPALSMSPAILPATEGLPCLRSESPLPHRIERHSPKSSTPD